MKIIPPIEMIGVWDTVSAMGFPVKEIADFINLTIYRFKFENQDLADNVARACHALSIDDERKTFHPLLWNENEETQSIIEQVWFSGVHANVGGGYPKQGMSLVTLDWMLHKAGEKGLIFNVHDEQNFTEHRNVNDKLYNSRSGIKAIYRYTPRNIGTICAQHDVPPRVHLSALQRVAQSTEGYAPGNVPNTLEVVDHRGNTTACNAAQKLLRDSLDITSSLLSKTGMEIVLRISTHALLLAIFIFLFAMYFTTTSAADGLWSSIIHMFSINGLIDLLIFTVKNYWWLIIIAIALYKVGSLAEKKMKAKFSEFYHRILIPLRKIFSLTNEKV
jgi:hypothetical protein